MNPSDPRLIIEAQRLRESGVLGEARLRQLFDYLVEKTIQGESPKEIVIAMDVFGKGASFRVGEDAVVRVYVHKLRKALSLFYSSAAASGGYSLHLPKGDYRLHLQMTAPEFARPNAKRSDKKADSTIPVDRWLLTCAFLCLVVSALLLLGNYERSHAGALMDTRNSPVWSEILSDGKPITIVMGDYYLLGETDDSKDVKRLIREFSINSRTDLDRHLMQHPNDKKRLLDVGFHYLPTSSADALRHVMAILAPADRRITVRTTSALPVSALKSSDVIYIGFVSGMAVLQDTVFKGSRLSVGTSYDELVDTTTGQSYVSQEVSQVQNNDVTVERRSAYHDYGMFAKLRGPGGNVVLIIAGTRDEGLGEAAEELTTESTLKALTLQIKASETFEGLLEVGALEGVGMGSRLIFMTPRSAADLIVPEDKTIESTQ